MLCLLERIPAFRDLESDILNLKSKAESISKQLGAWIRSLQDSGMKGQRYVTEKTRQAAQNRRERDAFLEKLDQIRKGDMPPPEKTAAGLTLIRKSCLRYGGRTSRRT